MNHEKTVKSCCFVMCGLHFNLELNILLKLQNQILPKLSR